jgi:fumarylpyruvate hydrolase
MNGVTLPFGEERFAVRRVYCVGQNYSEHVREMGGDPTANVPCFFMKPTDGLLGPGARVPYPPETRDFQHEVELVVALGSGGRRLDREGARRAIRAYGVGLDLTRRDLQADLKRRAHPWELAKSFTGSAVVSALVPWGPGLPPTAVLRLTVNGTVRQEATLGAMIRDVEDLLVILSRYDALAPGDLLFTGTPAGVGPLGVGDRLEAVCGEARLEASVVEPS